MTPIAPLLTVLAVALCTSAEYLYEDDTVEDLGMRVSRCLWPLPATVPGRPFDALTPLRPGPAALVPPGGPGADVCVRQVMETLWDDGTLEDARNTVGACLFDNYPAAFEAVAVPDASPAAAVLRGLECAINVLNSPVTSNSSTSEGNEN